MVEKLSTKNINCNPHDTNHPLAFITKDSSFGYKINFLENGNHLNYFMNFKDCDRDIYSVFCCVWHLMLECALLIPL
jgi:hypothetical protein